MENYDEYKKARDMSWEVLIKCEITALPVDLKKVTKSLDIDVISFKKAIENGMLDPSKAKGSVQVRIIKGRKTVFVKGDGDPGKVRFSIAKGIGFCMLSDKPWYRTKTLEYSANIFARDLLMPATVLASAGIFEAGDIAKLCGVSSQAAQRRAARLAELKTRNRFNAHPLERKVRAQFDGFIADYKRQSF